MSARACAASARRLGRQHQAGLSGLQEPRPATAGQDAGTIGKQPPVRTTCGPWTSSTISSRRAEGFGCSRSWTCSPATGLRSTSGSAIEPRASCERSSRSPPIDCPQTIRVDQGTEFVSRDLNLWAYAKGVTLDLSRPGKPSDTNVVGKTLYDGAGGSFLAFLTTGRVRHWDLHQCAQSRLPQRARWGCSDSALYRDRP